MVGSASNYIALEYRPSNHVIFTISGRELWQYRIKVRDKQYRWHENKTTRCARAAEKQAREEAKAKAAEQAGGSESTENQ